MNYRSLGLLALFLAEIVAAFAIGVPPAAAQSFTEYTIPTANSYPFAIIAGPDGNLWFTEDGIGKVTTSGAFTEYSVPTFGNLGGITAGPDGNLWFTEGQGNKIGKVTTSGAITEYPVPTANSLPALITVGPDGNIWFTESNVGKIGKVTTSGTFTEYPLPNANSQPSAITAGPDGNLWFVEFSDNKIGKMTTGGALIEYNIPTAISGAHSGIIAGPDGNLWFTEGGANKIAKVTTSGTFTEYTIPTTTSGPYDITVGPDGNLWFTEYGGSKIAKVTTGGTFTEYAIPTTTRPTGITAGPDGAIWFNESDNANTIARFNLELDHFTCYKAGATRGSVKFSGIANPPGVSLVDQFGSSTDAVKRPRFLCTPTNKLGEDPTAPAHPEHLTGYPIKNLVKPVFPTGIQVVDQFNASGLLVDAKKQAHLLVPTAKDLNAPPPTPAAFLVDHFECYKIAVSSGTPKFVAVPGVTLQDQLGPMTVTVKKPTFLCNPVDKNGESPTAPTHPQHLLCYSIKQTDAAPFVKRTGIFINNQFGPETVDAKKPALLCVRALTP